MRSHLLAIGVTIGALAGLVAWVSGVSKPGNRDVEAAKHVVEKVSDAPSSLKFFNGRLVMSDAQWRAVALEYDLQNAFGATIRHRDCVVFRWSTPTRYEWSPLVAVGPCNIDPPGPDREALGMLVDASRIAMRGQESMAPAQPDTHPVRQPIPTPENGTATPETAADPGMHAGGANAEDQKDGGASAADLNRQGGILLVQGRLEDAIHLFDGAIELDPRMTGAITNKGYALLRLNRLDGAESAAAEALNMSSTPRIRASAKVLLGKIAEARGNAREARGRYEEALREQHGYPQAKEALAALPLADDRAEGLPEPPPEKKEEPKGWVDPFGSQ